MSLEEKTKIMCWAAEGVKTKQIAARLAFCERPICMHLDFLKSLQQNATPLLPQTRFGCPSKTNRTQDLRLMNYVEKNPFKTAKELKN